MNSGLTQQAATMERPPADLGVCVACLVNAVYREMTEQVVSRDLNPLEFALLNSGPESQEELGEADCTKAHHRMQLARKRGSDSEPGRPASESSEDDC